MECYLDLRLFQETGFLISDFRFLILSNFFTPYTLRLKPVT